LRYAGEEKIAANRGLDANVWFDNVEYVAEASSDPAVT
jgi:hypothetical protein